MNTGKTIFSQLMEFLPLYEFRQCVERYDGNHKVHSFSCLDQFLCMAFAQLTYRESLRDIEACLRAAHSKLYHLGIWGRVSRNTLATGGQNFRCPMRSDHHARRLLYPQGLSEKLRRIRFLDKQTNNISSF